MSDFWIKVSSVCSAFFAGAVAYVTWRSYKKREDQTAVRNFFTISLIPWLNYLRKIKEMCEKKYFLESIIWAESLEEIKVRKKELKNDGDFSFSYFPLSIRKTPPELIKLLPMRLKREVVKIESTIEKVNEMLIQFSSDIEKISRECYLFAERLKEKIKKEGLISELISKLRNVEGWKDKLPPIDSSKITTEDIGNYYVRKLRISDIARVMNDSLFLNKEELERKYIRSSRWSEDLQIFYQFCQEEIKKWSISLKKRVNIDKTFKMINDLLKEIESLLEKLKEMEQRLSIKFYIPLSEVLPKSS